MKFILFNVQDINKTTIRKVELNDCNYINEITFSKSLLNIMIDEPKHILGRIKYKFYDKKIERIILRALDNYDKKWYYVLSKEMRGGNKYLSNKFEQLLGYKLSNTNEMDTNIFKHIDEYVNERGQLKSHELKVLLIVTNLKNLNINLLSNLINEYKTVNIYLKEKPTGYLLKRINQINKNAGSAIEILKKERKSFAEYDIIYFVDDFRENYPRFRFSKKSKVLDLEDAMQDKHNSNIIYLNNFLDNSNIETKNIQELKTKYNHLELAQVIKKITNVLDKS